MNDEDFYIPEFDPGGLDFDIDLSDFADASPETANLPPLETRYIKPEKYTMRDDQVMYQNAQKLARALRLDKGMRADCIIDGAFIFGDFIEAFIVAHEARCREMLVTTLSMSQDNIDSFHELIELGWVEKLDIVISDYFFSHEKNGLIPYMYQQLDIDDIFQLSVAGIHTKTCQFLTYGGKKIVMHGSANLRSSGNIEQFCIEENPKLYDFYKDSFSKVIEKFKTINKAIRHESLWQVMARKNFND